MRVALRGGGGVCLYLSRLQVKLGVEKLGEKLEEPPAKFLVTGDDLHHEVCLLQAGGEEIITTGLVAEGATPVRRSLLSRLSFVFDQSLLVCLVKHRRVLDNQFLEIFISINISKK